MCVYVGDGFSTDVAKMEGRKVFGGMHRSQVKLVTLMRKLNYIGNLIKVDLGFCSESKNRVKIFDKTIRTHVALI